jgi:hypothetical protein
MFSVLNPKIVYTDISSDIPDHDMNVVSDLWNMDGHEVYRGSRDTHYTHANVYWLYDEALNRVGLAEHNLKNHADIRLLWFQDSEFGTLLQENGWVSTDDTLWTTLPESVYMRFTTEGWAVSSSKFLEHCLHGPYRIVTPDMLINMPMVHSCSHCGQKSLSTIYHSNESPKLLDFPDSEKVVFIDDDFIIQIPPSDSRVFKMLQPHGDGSSQAQVALPQQEPAQSPPSPPPSPQPQPQHSPLEQSQKSLQETPHPSHP